MDKKKNTLGTGVAIGGSVAAVGLLGKMTGGFKALGLVLAGFFAHGGGTEVATLAPVVGRTATEVAALAPSLKEAPHLAPVTQAAVQVLVRLPGHERDQLAALAGDQRDKFLVMVAAQDVQSLGTKAYVTGAFRDWVPETVLALQRQGRTREAGLLDEARSLTPAAARWPGLDRDLRELFASR